MTEKKVSGCWGSIFRQAMTEQGISVYRMAKDLKIPLSTLQYRLRDDVDLKKSVFERFVNYLKIEL